MNPDRAEQRRAFKADPANARKLVQRILPDPTVRAPVLKLFVSTIERAHQHGSAVWTITMTKQHIGLTVGRCGLVYVNRTRVWLPFWRVEMTAQDMHKLDTLMIWHRPWKGREATVEMGDVTAQMLPQLVAVIGPAHTHFIDVAAQEVRQTPSSNGYAPGVMDYLEQEVGRKLPRPTFDATPTSGKGLVQLGFDS